MDLLKNDDVVTVVSFSVCQLGDVGMLTSAIRVTTGVLVEKAGKKSYILDGHRYPQGEYGTVLQIGFSNLSRRIVVPHGYSKDDAIALAKQTIKASVERTKAYLAEKLKQAEEQGAVLDSAFKVTEREWA